MKNCLYFEFIVDIFGNFDQAFCFGWQVQLLDDFPPPHAELFYKVADFLAEFFLRFAEPK